MLCRIPHNKFLRAGARPALPVSQRLAHLVGTNGFFCGLLRSARSRPGCHLDEWWSERRCAREWSEVVRCDGYGIQSEAGTVLPFLHEHDNDIERIERLDQKLLGYARLAAATGGLVLLVALLAADAGAGIVSLLGGGSTTPSAAAASTIPPAMLALDQQAALTCPGLS